MCSTVALKVCPCGGRVWRTWEQQDSGVFPTSLLLSPGTTREPLLSALKHWPQQKSLQKVRSSGPSRLRLLKAQFPEISDLSLPRARGPRAGQRLLRGHLYLHMWGLPGRILSPQAPAANGLVTSSPASKRVHPTTRPGLHPPSNPSEVSTLFFCFSRPGRDFGIPCNHLTDGSREESESPDVTYEVDGTAGPRAAPPLRPQPCKGLFPATGASSFPGIKPVPTPRSCKKQGNDGKPNCPSLAELEVLVNVIAASKQEEQKV